MNSRIDVCADKFGVERAARQLAKLTELQPTLAIVLGSGFGHAAEQLKIEVEVPYAKLEGFPKLGVGGHPGKVFLGSYDGVPAFVLSGRAHYYEGYSMAAVTFPVRVLAALGLRDLLLTNAAGGINRRFRAGDFMAITDHINFMGANPLRGTMLPGQERFIDMTQAYDERLGRLVRRAARTVGIKLHAGVYLAVSGPSYETPAEIRAFDRLGADAVGMSTVPEAIVARQCGIAVAGLSCITNLVAGRGNELLSHADVLASGGGFKRKTAALIEQFVKLYATRA